MYIENFMEQNLWLTAHCFSFWYWKLGGTAKKPPCKRKDKTKTKERQKKDKTKTKAKTNSCWTSFIHSRPDCVAWSASSQSRPHRPAIDPSGKITINNVVSFLVDCQLSQGKYRWMLWSLLFALCRGTQVCGQWSTWSPRLPSTRRRSPCSRPSSSAGRVRYLPW